MPTYNNANFTLTANGNSDTVKWTGGPGNFSVEGTWGGATAKLQFSPDGATWLDVDNCSFTADANERFQLGPCDLRVNVAAGTAPDLDARIRVS